MSLPQVVVFPNTYVELNGADVWTTEDLLRFVTDVKGCGLVSMIAIAAGPYVEDSRHDSLVDPTIECQFTNLLDLGGGPRTRVRKACDYLRVLYRLLTRVPRNATWYIFLPNHAGVLAGLICCLLGKRFGLYVRGEYPKKGVAGWLHKLFFRRADFIFATGEALTGKLRQHNPHVEMVAPMMAFELGDLRERKSYQIQGKAKILYAGSIHPAKGAFELVRALPFIAKEFDVEFIIAGTGTQENLGALQTEINATGHADRITLAGYVGEKMEMTELYAGADLFCFPSHSEGFARVIYEAMGFGLPILSTDFEEGDGKYFLKNRENCLFIAMRNPADLAERMIELLEDHSLRETLGRRGFQDAKTVFTKYEGVSHGSQVVEAIRAIAP